MNVTWKLGFISKIDRRNEVGKHCICQFLFKELEDKIYERM